MSSKEKENVRKKVLEKKGRSLKEKEKPSQSFISKHLKKVYPLGIHKSGSSLSLSSLNSSNDSSSLNGPALSTTTFGQVRPLERMEKVLNVVAPPIGQVRPFERKEQVVSIVDVGKVVKESLDCDGEDLKKRCPWITKRSDEAYVIFHDEFWGVPVYEDNELFEMLALSGMLMYHLMTEILKRKDQYRDVFGRFNPNVVAKMSEKEIKDISSNKDLALPESQVRSIVDNAKCILEIVKEYGSFGEYLWGYMNYKPMINRYRYPKSVPLRSPKAEAISRDLIRRGFRFVGPVIVYSFMQAAGMSIDHLVDCFRFTECVSLAEKRHGHG